MTHKNPELRAGSVVKAKESSPKPKTTPSYGKAVSVYIGVEASCHCSLNVQVAADKPSRFELDGNVFVGHRIHIFSYFIHDHNIGKKWVVEYMKDNPSVNISDAQPNQTV